MAGTKPRVLYLLRQYPLVCESYIQTEIDALRDRYDIRVMCKQAPPEALATMRGRAGRYDPDLLDQFATVLGITKYPSASPCMRALAPSRFAP